MIPLPPLLHSAVFWLWISFGLFVVVVGRPAFRAIVHILDRKRAVVDLHLSEVARQRQEAADMLALYQRQMEEAAEEARRMVLNAEEDARHTRAEAAAKLKQTLALRESVTASHIAEAESAALREAQTFAASLALATSREVLQHHLPPGVEDMLVDQAIIEVPARVT